MNPDQLEHQALKVRVKYGGKCLCQHCLLDNSPITSPEHRMDFEDFVWFDRWTTRNLVRHGTCDICGEEKEVMTVPHSLPSK